MRREFDDIREQMRQAREAAEAERRREEEVRFWRNAYVHERTKPPMGRYGHHRYEDSEDSDDGHSSVSESESDDERESRCRSRSRGMSASTSERRPRRKHRFRFWKNKSSEEVHLEEGVKRGKRILEERGHRLLRVPGGYIGF